MGSNIDLRTLPGVVRSCGSESISEWRRWQRFVAMVCGLVKVKITG